MEENDIFLNKKVYPNASDIFSVKTEPISKIKTKAIYIIDTNALLLPYTTSSKSIDEINKVYKKLIKDNRFFVPAQVAREFAKNRPEKIKEIFQQLTRKRSKLQKLYTGKYPLLTDSKPYLEAIGMEEKIDASIKEYSSKLNEVIEQIKNWSWDDPVTKTYNSIFNDKIIIEPSDTEENIIKDLKYRYKHKIPPGYKDGGKDDDGIGDLLIWLTILEIAKKENKDVIFVSGEEKADWYHRSEGQILYPRFELLSEFREKGAKKSFHIIKLSELLEIFGADEKVVKELEFEEKTNYKFVYSDLMKKRRLVESSVANWYFDSFNEYDVVYQEVGFPDITLTKNKEKIGVEIISFRKPELMLHRFSEIFNRAYVSADEQNFDKFHFVLVYPSKTNLTTVSKNSSRLMGKYGDNKLDFELIVGYVDDSNRFIRVD